MLITLCYIDIVHAGSIDVRAREVLVVYWSPISRHSNFQVLIGAHGAGLAWMVAMQPGGRVVELLPPVAECAPMGWARSLSRIKYNSDSWLVVKWDCNCLLTKLIWLDWSALGSFLHIRRSFFAADLICSILWFAIITIPDSSFAFTSLRFPNRWKIVILKSGTSTLARNVGPQIHMGFSEA